MCVCGGLLVMFFYVVSWYHSALIILCLAMLLLIGLCGAFSGCVLDGVIVAASSSIASWSWLRVACYSTARITRAASTAHWHTAWLLRPVLLVVILIIPTVSSTATGWATLASSHAASASVAVVAAEEPSGTTTSYLPASILTVIDLVLIHLAIVLHRRAARSSGWWTIVRLVSTTTTGTEAALRWTLLLMLNLLLLRLLLWRRLLLLLAFDRAFLDVVILTILGEWSRTTLASLLPPLTITTTFLCGVRTSLHWFTLRSGHVGCFVTLLANHYIKLDYLAVTNGTDCFFRVVASDG